MMQTRKSRRVMNKLRRDDLIKGRLYPFFLEKANLDIEELKMIHDRVAYIKTKDAKEYILKQYPYRKFRRLKQQWEFFKQIHDSSVIIPFVTFPNGEWWIETEHILWTLSPYVKGRKLEFSHSGDRKRAVSTVQQFHQDANQVYPSEPILTEFPILLRWKRRLQAFENTAYLFHKYRYQVLYQDLLKTMQTYFELAEVIPWDSLDEAARQSGQWIHRDVASHNFLTNDDTEQTVLIDFDLLTMGTPLQDYIQLGQRFLAYLAWDLDRLINVQMVPDSWLKYWLTGIMIPSDVIREWLYTVTHGTEAMVQHHLTRLSSEWSMRRHFLQKAEIMLKSL